MQSIAKNDQYPYYSVVETSGILIQLFSRFLEKSSSKQTITDERIVNILRYIRENINQNIKIEDLSSMCYLTKDHFIRLFKKEMNCTPLQYINQKKIEKAQLMMVIGKKPVKDIAFNLSFNELSYFYRLFKKITGKSPQAYKAQFQNEE